MSAPDHVPPEHLCSETGSKDMAGEVREGEPQEPLFPFSFGPSGYSETESLILQLCNQLGHGLVFRRRRILDAGKKLSERFPPIYGSLQYVLRLFCGSDDASEQDAVR